MFTVSATGLTPSTLYHYRAYATNSIGTSYTTDDTFTEDAVVPTPAQTTFESGTSATPTPTPEASPSALTDVTSLLGDLVNETQMVLEDIGNFVTEIATNIFEKIKNLFSF
ncbi:MAG: hypothetical protein WD988_01610 [Candidatus Curtissbacteria bacterium]